MATRPKTYLADLHSMEPADINAAACQVLARLLDRCTLNLVCSITGISRTTLYKWLDPDVPLESMNHRDAAWFIVMAETSPKMLMLMQRGPAMRPRLAKRMLDAETEKGEMQ